jgi:hypothetical protein
MKALWDHLTVSLRAFGREWSKARRHMLEDKQRNMNHWRHQKKIRPWPPRTPGAGSTCAAARQHNPRVGGGEACWH